MNNTVCNVWNKFIEITGYEGSIRYFEIDEATLTLYKRKAKRCIYIVKSNGITIWRHSKLDGTPDYRYKHNSSKTYTYSHNIEVRIYEYHFTFRTKQNTVGKARISELETFLKSLDEKVKLEQSEQ